MNSTSLPFALASLLAFSCFGEAHAQRLRVYVLVGQSNMQGHAEIRTFDAIGDDPATAPLLAKMRAADGKPKTCDGVWIADLTHAAGGKGDGEGYGKLTAGYGARRDPAVPGTKIGPEFTFGITMDEAHDDPVLIIKCAWGGKSLHTDFRPPSAGPFPFDDASLEKAKEKGEDIAKLRAEREAATSHYYRATIEHVKRVLADPKRVCPEYDAAAGYELAGFVWFQGWNDMVDRGVYPQRDQADGYAAYTECLAALVRDVRRDLDAPQLPFVIGVMGVGGPVAEGDRSRVVHRNFQAAMAAVADLPEFRDNVFAVPTAPYFDVELAALIDKVDQVRRFERSLRDKQKADRGAKATDEAQLQKEVAHFRRQLLSEADDRKLERGVSNAAYHYLGSAKTMARIGVAFAEALLRRPR
ncbi:MAG: sialate O-acetylesterase [Planctomycetota bacterium]